MKALVYHGPGRKRWEERPMPALQSPTDAIVRIAKTTICGTDLHILKGDVPSVVDGRILGHEGVGVIDSVGGRHGLPSRGPGAHLVHHLLWPLSGVQEGDVLSL
jgi:alcohol dehydrogenase